MYRNDLKKLKLTPELVRLHANICGDGYIGKVKTKRSLNELKTHPRKNLYRNRYHIRYCNTERELLNQFIQYAKIALNRKASFSKKIELDIQGKWVYDLFKYLGAGKSKEWFIHSKIMESSRNIKISWLIGFFNDESHISIKNKRIVLNIVNKKGLIQIQKILYDLGIKSTVRGPYSCREFYSYHLAIYRDFIPKFAEQIVLSHPQKAKQIKELIKILKK
ncbi:LAGLIDADG family homing endonuclease [Nanoarchaeota archaeon]